MDTTQTNQSVRPPLKRVKLNRPEDRDIHGKWVKGKWRGGPGNPLARQVNQLRSALVNAVTVDDIREIAQTLIRKAKNGIPWAVEELFNRTLGKPVEADLIQRIDDLEKQLALYERVEQQEGSE